MGRPQCDAALGSKQLCDLRQPMLEETEEPDVEPLMQGPSEVRPRRPRISAPHGSWQYKLESALEKKFHLSERGTDVATEIRAGLVTWVTMAYISVVNPMILSEARADPVLGPMSFRGVLIATCLTAAFGSFCAGWFANLPFGLAAGMGLNSYFTYGICSALGVSWRVALTACFMQGLLFVVVSAFGWCSRIQHFAPQSLKFAITVGIGLLQAFIGFQLMGVIKASPETLVTLGDIQRADVCLSLMGMLLIVILMMADIKGSMLVGIAAVTVIAWTTGIVDAPTEAVAWQGSVDELVSPPSHGIGSLWMQFDFDGYFGNPQVIVASLSLLLVTIFDTAGVQFGIGLRAGLLDENEALPGSTAAFLASSVSTTLGACCGTSPVIIHNETCAGIAEGGRTGLTAIVIAALFLVSPFLAPVIEAIPKCATAPPLVIVGLYMMSPVTGIDWNKWDEAFPSFVTVLLIPLTFSIANGVSAGLLAFIVLRVVRKYVEPPKQEETMLV